MPDELQKSLLAKPELEESGSDDFDFPVAPPPPPKEAATRIKENKQPLSDENGFKACTGSTEVDSTTGGIIPGETRVFQLTGVTNIQMCWIPPGKFMMGSPLEECRRENDESQHLVELSKGFWMAKYVVTQEQWFAVMGCRPSVFGRKKKLKNLLTGSEIQWKTLPIESVSWMDICGNNSRNGSFLGKVNSSAPKGWRFDLPSETQWEYACRAGTTTAFNNGGELGRLSLWSRNLSKLGWYAENSSDTTHPVGQKIPNNWGLYDMHGNVWEWCSNHYAEYPMMATIDPQGPFVGVGCVNRGGSWASLSKHCRSAFRSWDRQEYRGKRLGFRLVLRIASE